MPSRSSEQRAQICTNVSKPFKITVLRPLFPCCFAKWFPPAIQGKVFFSLKNIQKLSRALGLRRCHLWRWPRVLQDALWGHATPQKWLFRRHKTPKLHKRLHQWNLQRITLEMLFVFFFLFQCEKNIHQTSTDVLFKTQMPKDLTPQELHQSIPHS